MASDPMSKEFIYQDIRVLKWSKHNERSDVKRPHWFRVDMGIADDPDLHDFNGEEFRAWIYILAMCCRKNSDVIRINLVHAKTSGRIKIASLKSAFKKLERNQSIEQINSPLQTDKQTNRQTDTPERSLKHSGSALPEFKLLEALFLERGVTEEIQKSWLDGFPDVQWIIGEIRKAIVWETSNPNRKKKRFGAFISRWLTKGWDERKVPAIALIRPASRMLRTTDPERTYTSEELILEANKFAELRKKIGGGG